MEHWVVEYCSESGRWEQAAGAGTHPTQDEAQRVLEAAERASKVLRPMLERQAGLTLPLVKYRVRQLVMN